MTTEPRSVEHPRPMYFTFGLDMTREGLPMSEEEYQVALAELRRDWGSVHVDPNQPGCIRAENDPLTGSLIGRRSRLFAEIINRALREEPTQ